MIRVIPTYKNTDSLKTALLFKNHAYRHYELPENIVFDQDLIYMCKHWKKLFALLRTRISLSYAYQVETDGQSDLLNNEMEGMIPLIVSFDKSVWHNYLVAYEVAYKSSVVDITTFSPFFSIMYFFPKQ